MVERVAAGSPRRLLRGCNRLPIDAHRGGRGDRRALVPLRVKGLPATVAALIMGVGVIGYCRPNGQVR